MLSDGRLQPFVPAPDWPQLPHAETAPEEGASTHRRNNQSALAASHCNSTAHYLAATYGSPRSLAAAAAPSNSGGIMVA